MTPAQQQYCKDVKQAMETWNKYHEDKTLNAELQEFQVKCAEEYKASQQNDSDELNYYYNMNILLKKVSGVNIPELVGTGDPKADLARAMKIIS